MGVQTQPDMEHKLQPYWNANRSWPNERAHMAVLIKAYNALVDKYNELYEESNAEEDVSDDIAEAPEELREEEGGSEEAEDDEAEEVLTTFAAVIPSDFPGVNALRRYGIHTLSDIPPGQDALVAIPGIGASTARKILDELKS